jgi:hypothetical protein
MQLSEQGSTAHRAANERVVVACLVPGCCAAARRRRRPRPGAAGAAGCAAATAATVAAPGSIRMARSFRGSDVFLAVYDLSVRQAPCFALLAQGGRY